MRIFFQKIYKNLCWIYACGLVCFGYQLFYSQIPDDIYIARGEEINIEANIPIIIRPREEEQQVLEEVVGNEIEEKNIEYQALCYLFGMIPIKEITVNVVEPQAVYASGRVVGIYEETEGILVLQSTTVEALNGVAYEPAVNKILKGDYITHINHDKIDTKEELVEAINENGGNRMVVSLLRKEESIDVAVTPVLVEGNQYMLGLWVKDDMAGIGTLTYYKADGTFGALGHGITDGETGEILNTKTGTLYRMAMAGIKKGKAGTPGEVQGLIYYGKGNLLGSISTNCTEGLYGALTESKYQEYSFSDVLYPVAYKQEIQKGRAYLLSDISGELKSYEIAITEVDYEPLESNKGIRMEVTDETLLALTGGIVQGMSGSPIIQNERIVGAVTHVLVNDPTRGYGIFIENMLGH